MHRGAEPSHARRSQSGRHHRPGGDSRLGHCVLAGFPCQPYSQAGRRDGLERGRVPLRHLLRLLERSNPSIIVLENVAFILHLHGGAAVTWIANRLARCGYSWAFRVVDSQAFGLPQRRQRLILRGKPRIRCRADHSHRRPRPPCGRFQPRGQGLLLDGRNERHRLGRKRGTSAEGWIDARHPMRAGRLGRVERSYPCHAGRARRRETPRFSGQLDVRSGAGAGDRTNGGDGGSSATPSACPSRDGSPRASSARHPRHRGATASSTPRDAVAESRVRLEPASVRSLPVEPMMPCHDADPRLSALRVDAAVVRGDPRVPAALRAKRATKGSAVPRERCGRMRKGCAPQPLDAATRRRMQSVRQTRHGARSADSKRLVRTRLPLPPQSSPARHSHRHRLPRHEGRRFLRRLLLARMPHAWHAGQAQSLHIGTRKSHKNQARDRRLRAASPVGRMGGVDGMGARSARSSGRPHH